MRRWGSNCCSSRSPGSCTSAVWLGPMSCTLHCHCRRLPVTMLTRQVAADTAFSQCASAGRLRLVSFLCEIFASLPAMATRFLRPDSLTRSCCHQMSGHDQRPLLEDDTAVAAMATQLHMADMRRNSLEHRNRLLEVRRKPSTTASMAAPREAGCDSVSMHSMFRDIGSLKRMRVPLAGRQAYQVRIALTDGGSNGRIRIPAQRKGISMLQGYLGLTPPPLRSQAAGIFARASAPARQMLDTRSPPGGPGPGLFRGQNPFAARSSPPQSRHASMMEGVAAAPASQFRQPGERAAVQHEHLI